MGDAPDDEVLQYPNSDSDHASQQQDHKENNDEENNDDPDRTLFLSLTGSTFSFLHLNLISNVSLQQMMATAWVCIYYFVCNPSLMLGLQKPTTTTLMQA